MPITRLNHAVLFVRDVERSVGFYTRVLGFTRLDMTPEGFQGAAFLRAAGSTNDHDLGLFEVGPTADPTSPLPPSATGQARVGLYHLAWEVDTLTELEVLRDALAGSGALVGASDHGTTKSLYGQDPDGLEFEIAWLVPAAALDDAALAARKTIGRLDLEREKIRYGAATKGGVGVSVPA